MHVITQHSMHYAGLRSNAREKAVNSKMEKTDVHNIHYLVNSK